MLIKTKKPPPPPLNLANLLSLARLFVLPAFFYFLFYYLVWYRDKVDGDYLNQIYYLATVGMIPVVLLTDFFDGWVARRYDLENPLGAFLDPLADKFFAFFSLALLAWADVIPAWLAMIVFFKEMFILIGWLLLFILGYETNIEPSLIGKCAAICQAIVVFAALLSLPHGVLFDLPGFPLFSLAVVFNQLWFHILTAVLTTLAGTAYVIEGLRRAQVETPPVENVTELESHTSQRSTSPRS